MASASFIALIKFRSWSPLQACRSEPQTFARIVRTTIAPGSGSGTAYSSIRIGSPAP
jgi:hypothetical protein